MNSGGFRCAVIGAANIDIGGFPAGKLAMQDSNPGRIAMSTGGVGRNIACNLARLGVDVQLITALGRDAFADILRADCARCGVGLEHALTVADEGSSCYLFIADAAGDMQLAVSDMDICHRLTPEALEGCLPFLNQMDAVVLDANLDEATLAFLAPRLHVPLLADAVSTAKARRLLPALNHLRALKPNAIEAEMLTGVPVHDEATARQALATLTAMGVERAFITLGEKGVCFGDAEQAHLMGAAPVRMVNATGAGDAFTAALAWAQMRGLPMAQCAAAGMAAAAIAVESMETVSPAMSEEALLARMEGLAVE